MMTLKVKDKEYKVKFGYNSFCDSDLLDRTTETMKIVDNLTKSTDSDGMANIQKMFTLVRDLLFEGFKKLNPVGNKTEVGDILDDYLEEDTENHGLLNIFVLLSQELLAEGFFGDLLKKSDRAMKNLKKSGKVKTN